MVHKTDIIPYKGGHHWHPSPPTESSFLIYRAVCEHIQAVGGDGWLVGHIIQRLATNDTFLLPLMHYRPLLTALLVVQHPFVGVIAL